MSATVETWTLRLRTLEAMAELVRAHIAIAALPLPRWSRRFALSGTAETAQIALARCLAAHVVRGAGRLPIASKCLPQALALSRMLRRRGVPHRLIVAVRPAAARGRGDDLHAWIELAGQTVLGELPGPWLPVLSLG